VPPPRLGRSPVGAATATHAAHTAQQALAALLGRRRPVVGMLTAECKAVVARYRRYLLEDLPELLEDLPELLEDLPELRGRTLYCFCAPPGGLTAADRPHVCHGQVLAELADALPAPPP
jgi:transposase